MDEVETRFLAAILADPDDDDARLIYADWLAERNDPRAEYLRLDVTLYRAPDRMRALAGTLDPAWVEHVARRFCVLLVDAGPNLIATIKLVRALTGLGLGESKNLVDRVHGSKIPTLVRDGLDYHEAQEIAAKFPSTIRVRIDKSRL